jgi:8-oxo-dGTP pyrophosphatase MutT (NUDIX family)
VVLLDEADRVLLARFEYGGKRWWTAPGGGLEDGETHEQVARREIAEETGHVLGQLGPWVWTHEHVFRFDGRLYRQVERYFIAHVSAFDPLLQELGVEEAKALAGVSWWTPAELEEAEEEFAPADLPALVRGWRRTGLPNGPSTWAHNSLFTGVRGTGILGSSSAENRICAPRTPWITLRARLCGAYKTCSNQLLTARFTAGDP